jgi:hypothetical protein
VHMQKVLERLPDSFTWEDRKIIERLYLFGFNWWFSLLEGQQICRELALGLVAIHLLRYTTLSKPFVTRYFTHNPWSGRVLTLFTGQLGHSSWLHLLSNVTKLIGFGKLSLTHKISTSELSQVKSLGIRYGISKQRKENDYTKHSLDITSSHSISQVCLSPLAKPKITIPTAGVVASLSSHIWLTRCHTPALARAFLCPKIGSKLASHTPLITSGASGAASANMAIFALEWWNPQSATVSFPATEWTMGPLLLRFVAVDLVGLRHGWR